MDLSQLHFAYPIWLSLLIVIPLAWGAFFLFYRPYSSSHQLEKFIDPHLLPYLLVNTEKKQSFFWKTLCLWSVVWICLTLALAGPRWDFKEIETFSKDQSLVILLDLSESMNATDVKPSRIARAKQKIEDLINLSKGVKIGLVAFAADPHMITPLTEDKDTIRHLLPSLGTDLVFIQGSKLSPALDMAALMFDAEPGNNKSLLVISDGGFEDISAILTARKLAEKGIVIHAMGIGTKEGAPILDHEGVVIKKNGVPIMSRLENERFSELNKAGNGYYLEAHYSDHAETVILNELEKRTHAQLEIGKKSRLWDERFYVLILAVLPIILLWFKRGYVFIGLLFFLGPISGVHAAAFSDYWKNSEQLGKQAFDSEDYKTAIESFQDSYRKGVAYYKAGDFAKAEKMFQDSHREEIACDAAYNLGNTFAKQQKFKEAIAAYEGVLKKWPDHQQAKENLELVQMMLEQQQEESSDSENSKSDSEKNKNQKQEKENSDQQDDENNEDDSQDESKKDQESSGQENQSDNPDSNESKDNLEQENEDSSLNDQDNQTEDDQPQDSDPNENPQDGIQEDIPQNCCQDEKNGKSQEDQEADFWLNRIGSDPKTFLKNKFYIESKRNGTAEGIDPW